MKTEFEISDWATYCKHVTLQKALDALWHCREAENDRLNNGIHAGACFPAKIDDNLFKILSVYMMPQA